MGSDFSEPILLFGFHFLNLVEVTQGIPTAGLSAISSDEGCRFNP